MNLETQTVWIAPSELSHINIKSFEKREGVIVLTEAELSELKEQVRKEVFRLGYDTAMSMPD